MKDIEKLLEYQKQIANIQYTINLLNWDLKISTPKKSEDNIIELISKYEKNLFNLQTNEKYEELLKNTIEDEDFNKLDTSEQKYIYNLLKNYHKAKKIPEKFYIEYGKLQNKSNAVWREARLKDEYNLFKPYLKEIIEMTKQYYRYLDSNSQNLYDTMLDNYETGTNTEIIDKLFNELKLYILPLISNLECSNNKNYSYNYTKEELIDCANYLLKYIGLDIDKIKLDIYPHGFTEKMCHNDIRIAFKKTNNPFDFVTTIIHEGGHALFEQNIKENLSRYENITIGNLYALHESQSRFYENILGRNKNFWIPIYDEISKKLKLNMTIDQFMQKLNYPELSLIRTEADELTYCMHIILRYEIERDIFNNKLNVDEIPEVWNKKMKDYLNVEVNSSKEGVMQDVHWSEGNFGYFPSYLLGSIYDGMFLEVIEKELGNIDELLKKGEIIKITNFLIDSIYKNGGAYTSIELLNKLYKKELSAKPLGNYLLKKYKK